MLLDCTHCDGFIPPQHDSCPHCGETTAARRALANATKAAAVGATMMTLMACYGAGYDSYDQGAGVEQDVDWCGDVQTADPTAPIVGGLAGGAAALGGSCMSSQGSAQVQRYHDPDIDGVVGRLTINWTSNVPVGVFVVASCSMAQTPSNELGCAAAAVSGSLVISNFNGRVIDIVVDGSAAADYQLEVSFSPGACGNGIIEGDETCDDGNQLGGDGCSATCSDERVEACELAQELMMGSNVGDTATLGSTVNGCAGPDKIYQFTAPSFGTLAMTLDAETNMALSLLDTCDGNSIVGSCDDVEPAGTPEFGSIVLMEGQSVYVVVDAVDVADGGPYQLDALFSPAQ